MRSVSFICALCVAAALLMLGILSAQAEPDDGGAASADVSGTYNPYADNNGNQLPKSYTGPRYRLNHYYPEKPIAEPVNPPWRAALGGKPIGPDNAVAYVQALKDYIAPSVRMLVDDYRKWDPFARNWFAQPWMAPKIPDPKSESTLLWPGREPIQGAYAGPGFTKQYYGTPLQEYVAVYYNPIAAYTLYKLWQKGTNPYDPNINTDAAQFNEGAIIVKLALTTAQGHDPCGESYWPVLQGSARSRIFVPTWKPVVSTQPSTPNSATAPPQFVDTTVLQFDIIVKDSKTSPETGWVFSTLVYDRRVRGRTTWDRMVPFGAMWGNDPEVAPHEPKVNAGTAPNQELTESVVNPKAPAYSKITLGYGNRLTGPNDAGAAIGAPKTFPTLPDGRYLRLSSCMSCHGTAEWPGISLVPPTKKAPTFEGPDSWAPWFQSRSGTEPQTPGSVALDYDMVTLQALTNRHAASAKPAHVEHARRRMQYLRQRGH